ncbi:hypothetical protein [Rubinisphaera italica]|uniref:Uncharacterized protein n=1 Tax=Rubinisphaera italica TaxID=2527969 RepID=A0A5C5XRP8_9PLAN|nr:hypothetical protein [Rubinisphaera italica]TWT64412.1 hypothetical protein Pan54_51740 [Rubinisphaera italica]
MRLTIQKDIHCPYLANAMDYLGMTEDDLSDRFTKAVASFTSHIQLQQHLYEYAQDLIDDELSKIAPGWSHRLVTNYIVAQRHYDFDDGHLIGISVAPRQETPSLIECHFSPDIKWDAHVKNEDAMWKQSRLYKEQRGRDACVFEEPDHLAFGALHDDCNIVPISRMFRIESVLWVEGDSKDRFKVEELVRQHTCDGRVFFAEAVARNLEEDEGFVGSSNVYGNVGIERIRIDPPDGSIWRGLTYKSAPAGFVVELSTQYPLAVFHLRSHDSSTATFEEPVTVTQQSFKDGVEISSTEDNLPIIIDPRAESASTLGQ